MADMKQNGWKILFWVIFSVVILAGAVYFAWNRTDEPTTTDTTTQTSTRTCDKESTMLTEFDELNENEVEITACNFEEEVVQAKGVVLVDAYASWCSHCQKLSPVIARIANDYAGRAKVGKLNANNQDPAMKDNFDFARENGLEGYPTVWIYKDGKMVDSFSGERTYEEVKALLDKQL